MNLDLNERKETVYQTAFNSSRVDAREMGTLVEWLQKKTGATVTVESVILVSTDSVEISNMLDALRNSMKNGKKPAATNGKAKSQKQSGNDSTKTMGRGSRRIEATCEILSLVELKKRIADGAIPDQALVTNYKNERFVVVGADLIQEPQA